MRIPQGYHDLYGIISDVGATALPENLKDTEIQDTRWMTAQLVGEVIQSTFERGISQYPNINDKVHLVTEEDLLKVYGTSLSGQITIGRLSNAENIPVKLDLDKLLTRHSAVLGSTGSGKSTTVASLLRSISSSKDSCFPSARVLLLDIHGEYGSALADTAAVFRVRPLAGENPLHIPYWALPPKDLLDFVMGALSDQQEIAVLEKVFSEKEASASRNPLAGLNLTSMNVDSPVPYSLKKIWHDLIDPEIKTWSNSERTDSTQIDPGNADRLTPPTYLPATTNNTAPFLNRANVLGIKRQLGRLRSLLLDRQYEFLLTPGPWSPDLDGNTDRDLSELLHSWMGHDKPITVLDLSGIPGPVLIKLIGAILSIIYDGLFWGREKNEGGRKRPQLIVMEEAHRYLGKDSNNSARDMVQRIVKEGRKFGIGAMIVSQRPSEIDDTILSQCGTFITLRLTNSSDQGRVKSALPDNLGGIGDTLPILRTGEALIVGEAAHLPIRCRVTLPNEDHRPNSGDPDVALNWAKDRLVENYDNLTGPWRAQDPSWETTHHNEEE